MSVRRPNFEVVSRAGNIPAAGSFVYMRLLCSRSQRFYFIAQLPLGNAAVETVTIIILADQFCSV